MRAKTCCRNFRYMIAIRTITQSLVSKAQVIRTSTNDLTHLQAFKVIFSQFYDIIQISVLLLHHLYMLKKHSLVPKNPSLLLPPSLHT